MLGDFERLSTNPGRDLLGAMAGIAYLRQRFTEIRANDTSMGDDGYSDLTYERLADKERRATDIYDKYFRGRLARVLSPGVDIEESELLRVGDKERWCLRQHLSIAVGELKEPEGWGGNRLVLDRQYGNLGRAALGLNRAFGLGEGPIRYAVSPLSESDFIPMIKLELVETSNK